MKQTFSRNLKTHKSNQYVGTVPNTSEGIQVRRKLRKILKPLGEIKSQGRNPNRQQFRGRTDLGNWTNFQSYVPTRFSTTLDLYLTPHNELRPQFDSVRNQCWKDIVKSFRIKIEQKLKSSEFSITT